MVCRTKPKSPMTTTAVAIELVEVGPRDGLQNESRLVPTAYKVELIHRAISAGARRIEVASFVNPRRVPQMADAEHMVAALADYVDIVRVGLVLNRRGAERAIACGIDQLGAVVAATDRFGINNQGQTCQGSVETAKAIAAMAHEAGRTTQATIAVAFGCPFEGKVDPASIIAIAERLARRGVTEVALADTIGVAVPRDVANLVTAVKAAINPLPVRVHFHDTRNTGIANVWAAVSAGATVVDASIGGLGGCPFAPGAAGNVATEDVVYLLSQSGVETGLDLDALVDAARWLGRVMEKEMPSMLSRAAKFPAGELV
ncbi:hydroxymethylglutaryl-CoA lyase [Sphingopyxis sp. 550A]